MRISEGWGRNTDRYIPAGGVVAERSDPADAAVQHKLNAIAEGLSDLMRDLAYDSPELRRDCKKLRTVVGLEDRESA